MQYTPEHIDRYLDGGLNTSEQKAFEQALQQDAQLRREVEIQQELRRGIRNKGNDLLKDRLRKIHSEEITSLKKEKTPEVKGKIIRFRRPMLGAVAAILLLVAVFVFFPGKQSPEKLFAQNYEPYEISLVQRGDEGETLAKADQDYRSGNYTAAITALEILLESQPANAKLHLVLGICFLETAQSEQAREHFQLALNNSLYQDKAQWYLALSYLREGDIKNAKTYLEPLSQDQNSSFRERAQRLLNKL